MSNDVANVTIENARLIYRNFTGAETPFKPAGSRTFAVVLDKKTADELTEAGWNVKCKPANEEDDEEFCFLEIAVGYKQRPPKVVVITDTSRTSLTEETIGTLDWADIRNVDLVFQPYHWEVGGKTGVKPYLKTMFVTLEEDDLERKYNLMDQQVSD